MKKTLLILMFFALAGTLTAQEIEFRMGEKTNKKAYQASMIKIAEGTQEGQLLVVEPNLNALAVGGYTTKSVKSLKVRLCDMDWNDIKSVTILRMEVPCCGGIENAVKKALIDSGKFIPWQVVTISTDGRIVE